MEPISMAIGGIASGISGLVGAIGANRRAKQAASAARRYEQDLARLEANRQEVIDPYAGVTDLSGMIANPFANLQVATQAAEMQAAETDISLASTLDTLRATGASAGGATALAQAASRAKQGVAASIAQQEAQNAQLRAQGEQAMQQARLQEAQRVQQAEVAGKQFVFGAQEQREMQKLDRLASLGEQYRMQEAQQRSAASQGLGQALGAAAGFGVTRLAGFNPFTGDKIG